MASCCVSATTLDVSDPCVCNANIGATLVTAAGDIYVRTVQSTPCSISDWQLLNTDGAPGSGSFIIQDDFSNTSSISDGDTLVYTGINGSIVTVNGDTVTIDGLQYFGNGVPATPVNDSDVNIYVDCANGDVYAWCPSSATWIGPFSTNAVETPLTVNDSPTVDLSISGTLNHTLTASVKLSATPGNSLIENADGLYVAVPSAVTQTPLTVIDSDSVDLTTSGTDNHTISATTKISGTAGNQVVINSDGLFVPATTIVQTPITVVDSDSVNLTANGADTHTLQADVKVSATVGNATIINADGIYTPAAIEPPLVVVDTVTVDLTASGTLNHTLQADVKLSSSGGNILVANPNGLYVPEPIPFNITSGPNATTVTSGPIIVDQGDNIHFYGDTIDFIVTQGSALVEAEVALSATADNILVANSDGLYVPTPAVVVQTPITVTDSATIDLTSSGTDNHTLTASSKLSATAGNTLVANADGLFVPTPSAATPLTVVDTPSVNLTASGTDNHTLQADTKISATAGNTTVINADGIFTPTPVQTTLTVTDTPSIDLTASGTDNHTLQAAAKISATVGNTLVVNADGLFVPTPGAATETTLTVVDTSSIDLTASGTSNHTLQAVSKISATAGNQVVVNADGLFVPAQVIVQTPLTVVDTPSVNLTSSGTDSHTVQADVKISATAGNTTVINADGIYTPAGSSSWTLAAESGTPQVIANGGTVTVTADDGIETSVAATGILDISLDLGDLPASPAVLPPTSTFVMAIDGASDDGSQATVNQVATVLAPQYKKLDLHPATPIAAVANLAASQNLLNAALTFETQDTDDIILGFGADGRQRATIRNVGGLVAGATALSIPAGSSAIVPYSIVSYQNNILWVPATFSWQIQIAGSYTIVGALAFDELQSWTSTIGPSVSAIADIRILVNGALIGISRGDVAGNPTYTASNTQQRNISIVLNLAVGDLVQGQYFNGSSAAKVNRTDNPIFHNFSCTLLQGN